MVEFYYGMLANLFEKPLQGILFKRFKAVMMGQVPLSSSFPLKLESKEYIEASKLTQEL